MRGVAARALGFRRLAGGGSDPLSWLSGTVAAIGELPACAYHFDTGDYAIGSPVALSDQATAVDAFFSGDAASPIFNSNGVEIFEAGQNGRTLDDDLVMNPGGLPWVGFSEALFSGVIEFEHDGTTGDSDRVFAISDGGYTNRFTLRHTGQTSALLLLGGGGPSFTIPSSGRVRLAFRKNGAAVRGSVNGGAVVGGTGTGGLSGFDRLVIGADPASNTHYNGTISKFECSNTDRSDAELIAWSAL